MTGMQVTPRPWSLCLFALSSYSLWANAFAKYKIFKKKNQLGIYNYTITLPDNLSRLIVITIISTVQTEHLWWYCQYARYWQSAHFCTAHPARINTGKSRNLQSPLPSWQDVTCGGNFREKEHRLVIFHQREQSQKMHITTGPHVFSPGPFSLSTGRVLQGSGHESGFWLEKTRKSEW